MRSCRSAAAGMVIGAFQDAVHLARGLLFGNVDQLFQPHVFANAGVDGDMRTLVVRAIIRDRLGAGTEAGGSDYNLQPQLRFALAVFTNQGSLIIHQALHTTHRRLLHYEERKTHFNVTGFGIQMRGHFLEHVAE